MPSNRLTIIGCGPKALAIAGKAAVLERLGFSVPEIRIVERRGLGANWKPTSGFTNGRLRLGTSPEKDIGFPYSSSCWDDALNGEIDREMQRFSWQSFLVERGTYAAWIDRGRPAPEHSVWADYLAWTFKKINELSTGLELIEGDFVEFELAGPDSYRIKVAKPSGSVVKLETEGLVMTGPGEIKRPEGLPDDPHLLDIRTFWTRLKDFAATEKELSIAVIGNGETAASTAVVVGRIDAPLRVDVVTPVAMNYSRGESFTENHMYTDPFQGNWHELTIEDRRSFVDRTDRGVFSLATKKELDQMEHVSVIQGWFRSVEVSSNGQLVVELDYNGTSERRVYDYVILSVGFDPFAFVTRRCADDTRAEICRRADLGEWSSSAVELKIGEDLSIHGLFPKLHLPMLSGLRQGPGFPNLSSLGRLSDHVLMSYVSLDRELA